MRSDGCSLEVVIPGNSLLVVSGLGAWRNSEATSNESLKDSKSQAGQPAPGLATEEYLGNGCFLEPGGGVQLSWLEKDDLKHCQKYQLYQKCQAWLALLAWLEPQSWLDAEFLSGRLESGATRVAATVWQSGSSTSCQTSQEASLATKCSPWSWLCVAA